MEIRKNWFVQVSLIIFIICMGYTLFCGILNIRHYTQYPLIWYAGILVALVLMRLFIKAITSLSSIWGIRGFIHKSKQLSIVIEIVIVIAVLIFAATIRILVIQELPIAPASDFQIYFQIATLLSQGDLIKNGVELCYYISEFPHVIGYSYILSKIFYIFGASVSVGLYFNLATSLISTFLAYRIGRLIIGMEGGIIALILVAFWPSQILYINHLAAEPVFTCMVLLSIWLAACLIKYPLENGNPYLLLLLSVALGVTLRLGAAVRPMAIILLIAIVLCILPGKFILNNRNIGLIKKAMSKGWLCVIFILISYLLCSQIVSGAITKAINRELPSAGVSFGYNLMVGLNIESKGAWSEQDAKLMRDKLLETDSAIEAHKAALDEALKRISKDPIGIVKLALEKYILLWKDDDYAASWNLLFMEQQGNLTLERKTLINKLIPWNNLYYLFCVFFSFLEGISLWRRKNISLEHILILFVIGTVILHMVLENQNRYHYDILPVFAILAAVGIREFFNYFMHKIIPPK